MKDKAQIMRERRARLRDEGYVQVNDAWILPEDKARLAKYIKRIKGIYNPKEMKK